jgi:micrococcal nuclease
MYKFTKRKIIYILAIIFAVLQLFLNRNQSKTGLTVPAGRQVNQTPTITPTIINYSKPVKVIRVVDGDTIEVEGNIKVRYIGINTPELHDPRRPVECFGQAASDENKKLVEGKTITMEKDVSEVDKYKRLLRYVWVEDTFVNDYLVRQGFAQVSTFPPDVKYASQFLEAQTEAKENNRGLWKNCPVKY